MVHFNWLHVTDLHQNAEQDWRWPGVRQLLFDDLERLYQKTGNWDLVCCGHSHKVQIETLPNVKGGETTLVNPGTVGGVGRSAATWILGDLENMQFDVHAVSKSIEFDSETA